MTQNQVNSAVARATGESLATIRNRGFNCSVQDLKDETGPECIGDILERLDWDQVALDRNTSLFPTGHSKPR
ncbi:hypothetical protein [Calycomorphotria hydatis]|uniref:Uncharacterized protein n=1 Tax=Calycomorphotria hydatis TaxID=2528027 RepID=A0A517T8P1_9PLAN|nr:hypothetical protein [Calycomorphotria hydatis]QDT64750.1 hypothetical protein V22_19910 [Calycomorphotria hydatis]